MIIENNDDFGGHAKRNEFHYGGHTLVDLGGTEYIEAPWRYPNAAKALLDDLGIDAGLARDVYDHDLYPSQNPRCGIFFEKKPSVQTNSLSAGPASHIASSNPPT